MPTAIWPQAVSPAGGSDPYEYQPSAPRGLFDMIAGTSEGQGSDFSSRLGILAQILQSVGTGRAMPDIGSQLGALDERSARRREKAKAERMVARAASKIADRNPELAAAMMADPAFGMQMLGKQYESEWESKNALNLQKEKYKLDLENDLAVKAAEREAYAKQWADLLGGDAGGTAPVSPEAPPPAPGISDVGAIPAPTGLTAGTGTEPAPTNLPLPGDIGTTGQPISAQPDLQQPELQQPPAPQQPAPIGSLDPLEAVKTMLSGDPQEAARQIQLTQKLGAPVPPTAIKALQSLVGQDPSKAAPIFAAITNNWEEQKRFIIGQQNIDRRALQEVEDTKAAEARALQEKLALPGMREKQYREGLTEVTGQRGPITTTQLDPASRDVMTTLKSQGFGLDDQRAMADPEAEAAGIIAGVRTAEGPGAAVGQTTTRLNKQREDLGKAADAEAARTGIQSSVSAMQATIPDKPEYAQMKAELAAVPFAKDPPDALNKWRKTNQEAIASNAQMRVADAELGLKVQEGKEKTEKIKTEASHLATVTRNERLNTLRAANVSQKKIVQAVKILGDTSKNDEIYGVAGLANAKLPGTRRYAIEGALAVVKSHIQRDALKLSKGESATGASGFGSLTAPELDLLGDDVTNVETALATGEGLEQALKELYNHYGNVINPTGGQRLDEDTPGFVLRDADIERDNPELFQLKKERGELGDLKREDRPGPGGGVTFEWVP